MRHYGCVRRRDLLTATAALAACRTTTPPSIPPPAEPGPAPTPALETDPDDGTTSASPFQHGIASGDPLPDRIILWTRVTPPSIGAEVEVRWSIAEDPEFTRTVDRGSVLATAARDHTVKVDAQGLAPGQTYHYRFTALGHRSATGRTRTAASGHVERVRIAVASCANYPYGHFNVYGAIAKRTDLDAVVHLGDYLYEYENGRYGDGTPLGREPQPVDREMVYLADYRARHAIYKTDPDLQAMHRQHPMIAVWDDHELTNDAWWGGAENHQENEGSWEVRRAAAVAAYREWMPIRELHTGPVGQIHRRFRYGDLLDLVMLDTRLVGRDRQANWHESGWERIVKDPSRTLLGRPQEAWLAQTLERSRDDKIAWRVLGQQVLMGQLEPRSLGPWVNTDMWDGYAPARARLLDHVAAQKIDNLIVLTGDIHSSWGVEIAADPFGRGYDPVTGRGALAVELVTPAVSSPPPVKPDDAVEREAAMLASHPHLRWLELRHRGYVLVDIDHDRALSQWHYVDNVAERSTETTMGKALAVPRGEARLRPTEG